MSRVKSYEERQTVALERIASALEKMAPSICAHGENTPCPYCLRDALTDGISNALPVIR